MKPNLKQIKTVFLIGIKGVGMATLAYIFSDLGIKVVGSDLGESFVTSYLLEKRQFKIYNSFAAKIIQKEKPDLVVSTGAHGGKTNPQFIQAEKMAIPALTQAQALGWLMNYKKNRISIAGVGGKTTISALLSHILEDNNYQPAYSIGAGSIKPLIWPGRWGQGSYFVAEADEYATCPITDHRPRFYWQKPTILILTNIEYDHPDVYRDLKQTLVTFSRFSQRVLENGGWLISYLDNPNNQTLIRELKKKAYKNIITYGFTNSADWQIDVSTLTYPLAKARVISKKGEMINLKLKLPGRFNLANATAATIAGRILGLTTKQTAKSLLKFRSVKRRFEFITQLKIKGRSIKVYDDYAHHPSEIKTTLKSAREWFCHKRIGVVFQSHTFSRTKQLLNDFIKALQIADDIYIAPIFSSAREKKETNINYQNLIYQKLKKYISPSQTLTKVKRPADIIKSLNNQEFLPDILLTMGAGDIYKWGRALNKYQVKT